MVEDLLKEIWEMDDDERENFYMDLDSMDEVKSQFDRFK